VGGEHRDYAASPTAYTVPTTGVYYAAVMVKATTVPTLAGVTAENAAANGAIVSGQAVLAQTSGSSLTTTAPATVASPTTVATIPYVVVT
jgi:anaerobic glycerol-3-phosphate dehydrogenase